MWASLPCPQPLCLWGRKCMDPWCWCGARLPVAPHHLQRPLCIPPPSRLLPQTATSLGSDQLQIGPHACLWIVGAWASTLKGSPSLFPICPAAPRSFLSHTHTAVIWLFKFSAAFLQLELVYDIPSADSLASRSLSPLSLALALSDAHTQIQHNLIFSCSVLSLPSASNVSCSSHSPADAVDVCCTTWYVWRQWRNKVTHTHTDHVLAVCGVGGVGG